MTRLHTIILIIFCIIFFLVGVGAIVGSFFARSRANDFLKNGIEIYATIVSIETYGTGKDKSSNAFVSYEVNGITYRTKLNVYTYKMHEGQTIPIRYMPNDPNQIAYAKIEYLGVWMLILVAIIFLLSAILLIVALKNRA